MTKNRIMQIILVSTSILIIAGVVLLGGIMSKSDDANVFKLSLEEGETSTVEFKNLQLIPGGSCEYTVKLKGERAKKYDLELNFVETEEKTLKNFAFVKILAGEDVICDKLLAQAFEDDTIVLSVDFSESKNTELSIVYYLPIDIGNEAKNAEAVFNLELTAVNE